MNILISTLGTGRYKDFYKKSDSEKKEIAKKGEYEETTYVYQETNKYFTSSMFSLAVQHIFELNKDSDKTIILGTNKSMWDEVLLHYFMNNDLNSKYNDFWDELTSKKAENKPFDKNDIDRLNNIAKEQNLNYEFYLMTNLTNRKEQQDFSYQIFEILSQYKKIDKLYIDITHAFRHIPYLITPVATFCKDVFNNITNIEIIYGMFEGEKIEIEKGKFATPIIKLPTLTENYNITKASNELIKYGEAENFIKYVKNNTDYLKKFSHSFSLALFEKIKESYNNLPNYNFRDKMAQKVYEEFKDNFKFLKTEDHIKAGLLLAQKYLEMFKVGDAFLILSQLIEAIKRKDNSLISGSSKDKLELEQKTWENIKRAFGSYPKIEALIDGVRNRIAHSSLLDNGKNANEKSIAHSDAIAKNLTVENVIEIIKQTINYLITTIK